MKSLSELFRIGPGPSSSHTIAPSLACESIKNEYSQKYSPNADLGNLGGLGNLNVGGAGALQIRYEVELFGSLAFTGKGHGTDVAVKRALGEHVKVKFNRTAKKQHPNVMEVSVFKGEQKIAEHEVVSLGGGAFSIDSENCGGAEVYPHASFAEIKDYCEKNGLRLCDYVYKFEPQAKQYLHRVWGQMKATVNEGLSAKGVLPGGLKTERKAKYLYDQVNVFESASTIENMLVCAYAFAAAEQNAAGGVVVTAPTCGACGVLPACLIYMQNKCGYSDEQIVNALAVAGVIGNIIKQNASISGAECGCQAEIGSACSMASAALCELENMDLDQIEYAAEVAMEHHLGLTCDPIGGLVQIPCIERNAVAAMRAINALSLAKFLTSTRKISFDGIVATMYATGLDLSRLYKETGRGGLAKTYKGAIKKEGL